MRLHARARSARSSVLVALLCSAMLAASCSTAATVSRHDGTQVRGTIEGREGGSLVLHDETTDTTTQIPLESIADIDHPGDPEIVVGSIIGAVSLIPLGVGAAMIDSSYDDGNGMAYAFGLIIAGASLPLLGTGLGLAIDGGLRWSASRDAAGDAPFAAPDDDVTVRLTPWVAPHGADLASGAGVSVSF